MSNRNFGLPRHDANLREKAAHCFVVGFGLIVVIMFVALYFVVSLLVGSSG